MTGYAVVIEHEGDSWGAYAPDLPGLGVAGSSRAEVEELVREAIEFHIEGLREAGEPIPPPTAEAIVVIQVA